MRISTRDKNRVNGAAREQLTHGSLPKGAKKRVCLEKHEITWTRYTASDREH